DRRERGVGDQPATARSARGGREGTPTLRDLQRAAHDLQRGAARVMSRDTTAISSAPPVEFFPDTVAPPIRPLTLAPDARAACALEFTHVEDRLTAQLGRRFGRFVLRRRRDPLGVREKLEAYFAGDLHAIDAIAVNPGGTPFQQAVWRALRKIPPGKTSSYGRL